MLFGEVLHLLVGKIAEGLVALVADIHGHYRLDIEGQCIGALGVGENVEVRNIETVEEIEGIAEVLIAFRGEAYDDIDTDTAIRHQLFDLCYALSI